MGRKSNNIDKTLKNLSLNKEAPKSAFILLLLLFGIAHFLVLKSSTTPGAIFIFGMPVAYSAFAGVFSTLSNVCILCLVMLFRKPGYIISLFLLLVQFPMMIVNVFVRGNMASLPGFFSTIMIIGVISIIYFSNRKILNYQQRIREQAVTDRITGLPNRFACGELVSDLHRHNEDFAIVSIDLNNFKSINDTMGHDTGDLVLTEVAKRWRELADSGKTGTSDFVARNSGDEFMIVISNYGSASDIEKTINAYKTELEKKITIDDCDYYLTACFGYIIYPDDTDNVDNLYIYADAALHEVKETGSGSRILRFTPGLLNNEKFLDIERKLRSAISGNKIFFHLQPQFDMDHNLRGFEALARMTDDDGAFISPADFIPVAEKTGLVDRIDLRVFELAVDFIEKVTKETGSDITMSINISEGIS